MIGRSQENKIVKHFCPLERAKALSFSCFITEGSEEWKGEERKNVRVISLISYRKLQACYTSELQRPRPSGAWLLPVGSGAVSRQHQVMQVLVSSTHSLVRQAKLKRIYIFSDSGEITLRNRTEREFSRI